MGWLLRFHQGQQKKQLLRLISQAMEAERYQDAVGLLETYLGRFPSDKERYQEYLITSRTLSRLPAAEAFLEGLLESVGEGNPHPANYLAAVCYLQGKIEEARSLWEGLISAYPGFAPAYSNLGALYMHLGNYDKAVLQFQVAISLEPKTSLSALNNLAEIYLAKGEYQTAQRYLLHGLAVMGEAETIYANLGHCYLASGQSKEAIHAYEQSLVAKQSLSVNDTRTEVYVNLVGLYLDQHDQERAMTLCLEGIQVFGQNAALWAALGRVYMSRKNYEEAIAAFRRSISLSPMSPRNLPVHRSLALAYFQQGNYGKATAEYRRALAWHPDGLRPSMTGTASPEEELHQCREMLISTTKPSADILRRMADAHFALGNLEDAIGSYEEALLIDDTDLESLVGLGSVYYSLDRHIDAVKYFSRALEIAPQCVEAHLGLGLTYLSQGSMEMALIKFKWAISITPTNSRAYNFLGKTYEIKGDLNEAISCYQRSLFLAPRYAQAHNNLGGLLVCLERYDQAIEEFQAALEIYPDYVPALCNLGQAYYKKGDAAKALKLWREALRLNPNNPLAESYLAKAGQGRDKS